MSELKATTAQEIVQNEKDCDYMDELFGGVKMPPTQVYLKSEADKVIAHNKYKRCVAMADYCAYKAWYYKYNGKEEIFYRWMKHRRVWAELAKKFKEDK